MCVAFFVMVIYVLSRSAASVVFVLAAPTFTPLYFEGALFADVLTCPVFAGLAYCTVPRTGTSQAQLSTLLCTHPKHHLVWTLIAVLLTAQYVCFSIAIVESDPASFGLGRTVSVLFTLIVCKLFIRDVSLKQWLSAVGVVLALLTIKDSFSFTSSARVILLILSTVILAVICDFLIDSQKKSQCFASHVCVATFICAVLEMIGYVTVVSILDLEFQFVTWYGWLFILCRMISNSLQYVAMYVGVNVETFRMCVIPSNILTLAGQSLFLGDPFPATAIPGIALVFLMLYWYILETSFQTQTVSQRHHHHHHDTITTITITNPDLDDQHNNQDACKSSNINNFKQDGGYNPPKDNKINDNGTNMLVAV